MYEFIQKHCLSKKGVIEDYKEEWDAVRYFIGGKMFAMVGNYKDGRPIVSLKHTPEYGIEVQEKYPDIHVVNAAFPDAARVILNLLSNAGLPISESQSGK